MPKERASGVLMHISSLPGEYGIGTLGKAAYDFVDFLKSAGQTYWQILPLCPTAYGNSPYQSFSTFAGNEYFIDPDALCQSGYLDKKIFDSVTWYKDKNTVDYGILYKYRHRALCSAMNKFKENTPADFHEFCSKNSYWLDDYAMFAAIKDYYGGKPLCEWNDDIKFRSPDALYIYREKCADEIYCRKMLQYFFFRQWSALKAYANKNGVKIIGDMPIYVSADSADVWVHPDIFKLGATLEPTEVAACPPDDFSKDGQLWGNPVYDWKILKRQNYAWWRERIAAGLKLCDIMRIDHFRGFEGFYCVKYGSKTARNGVWRKGPGYDFFKSVSDELGALPIIAENLGFLTSSVQALLDECGFAGMSVLQFCFDSRDANEASLPDKIGENTVVYTGTHDNDTIAGWAESADKADVARAMNYLKARTKRELVWKMIDCALKCNAETCIITMQDLLSLGSGARMNTPSTQSGNWQWRCDYRDIHNNALAQKLYKNTVLRGRCKRRNDE